MDYSFLLGSLEDVLGTGRKRSRDNYAFHCPFCNHRKPKLEINLATDSNGQNPWECWVCETRGKTIRSLLHQLKVGKEQAGNILRYLPRAEDREYVFKATVELPKEFQPLWNTSPTSIYGNMAKKYVMDRGLTEVDFLRYNIGYCTAGEYAGRVIIPSYDSRNQLNFFTGRSFTKAYNAYKNPDVSKDVIFFENLVNWSEPVILCEGPFDAMAIRRNAVPLLGKNISDKLLKKIVVSPMTDVYIALDKDALKKALIFCEQFLRLGKRVFFIDLDKKDPSKIGFREFTKMLQQAEELDLTSLMYYKLEL